MNGPPGPDSTTQQQGKRRGKAKHGLVNHHQDLSRCGLSPQSGTNSNPVSSSKASAAPAPGETRDLSNPNIPLKPVAIRDAVLRADGSGAHTYHANSKSRLFANGFDTLPFPRGILNSRNFCFMNAMAQALLFTPCFAQLAISAIGEADTCPTLAELGKWMVQYWKLGLTRLAMTPLRLSFATAGKAPRSTPVIDGSSQQDAQEFLQRLIDVIHDELAALEATVSAADTPGSAQTTRTLKKDVGAANEASGAGKGWSVVKGTQILTVRWHVAANGSRSALLDAIFGGSLQSHLKGVSRHRDHASVVVEPFYCLPVDIGARAELTIEEAIMNTLTTERIYDEGRNKELKKTLTIHTLPNVLFVHLRRWAVTAEGELVKLDNCVQYGRTLVLPRSVCSDAEASNRKRTYQLLSVVVHRGEAAGAGHYVTYLTGSVANPSHLVIGGRGDASGSSGPQPYAKEQLKSLQKGRGCGAAQRASVRQPVGGAQVILCNDAKVSVCSVKEMLAEPAYLLVYQKVA